MSGCIITGDELRHKHFAKVLSEQLDICLVAFEKKANTHRSFNYPPDEMAILEDHFRKRSESETQFFSDFDSGLSVQSVELAVGQANAPSFVERIRSIGIDYIVLFGCSLVQEPILSHFGSSIVNLHLGLSPYYRGSGTNFWPLVDGLPECVGATIHVATANVDAGGVLHQLRPNVAADDTIHDLGNKTIIRATEIIPNIVESYLNRHIKPVQQDLSLGKTCRRRDLTAQAVLRMYQNISGGMLLSYIADKALRDSRYPIIQQSV